MTIEQRLSVITLAADDLLAMRNFYENALGFIPIAVNTDIVFYKMNGFLLSIGKRSQLAKFIGVATEGSGFRAVTFGYNVRSEEEVRGIYEQLKAKGVSIIQPPTVLPFGGLFFYFRDIEGNILEVAHNAFIPLDDSGNAAGHLPIDHL